MSVVSVYYHSGGLFWRGEKPVQMLVDAQRIRPWLGPLLVGGSMAEDCAPDWIVNVGRLCEKK